ncbi:MAG: hypothetical protein ACLVAT_12605 [Lachnospiraceae bacterium]
MLGKLEETAKGIAWNYQVPEGHDAGGRPGRRISADRDGGERDHLACALSFWRTG